MRCPECGGLGVTVCSYCGTMVEVAGHGELPDPALPAEGSGSRSQPPGRVYLVVARGHRDLLDELRAIVGEMGWVRVIEDRRHDRTLLPRAGRPGAPFPPGE